MDKVSQKTDEVIAFSESQCMDNLELRDPYTVRYKEILGIASEENDKVELIEVFDCIGGAMWVKNHYAKSPLVESSRIIGDSHRFMIRTGRTDLKLEGSYFPAGICGAEIDNDNNTISVSYMGLGGGGVGASICRASAAGILRHVTSSEFGGGKTAGTTLNLPKFTRVVIGVDDTDTAEEGATWTLAHNISKAVTDRETRYLSHTITQLYPVRFRTKNCVAVACEFATLNPKRLLDRFEQLVRKYTLSDETGLCAYVGFAPESSDKLNAYAKRVKGGEISQSDFESVRDLLDVRMEGHGIIGAAAAIPYYLRYDEALKL